MTSCGVEATRQAPVSVKLEQQQQQQQQQAALGAVGLQQDEGQNVGLLGPDRAPQELGVAAGGVIKRKARSGPRSRTSPYIGVSQVRGTGKYKRTGRWEAHIWDSSEGDKGRQLHLGSFLTARQAAKAYDRAAIIMRGKAAELNFTMESYADDAPLKELRTLPKRAMVVAIRKLFDDPEEQLAMTAEEAAVTLLAAAAESAAMMEQQQQQQPHEEQMLEVAAVPETVLAQSSEQQQAGSITINAATEGRPTTRRQTALAAAATAPGPTVTTAAAAAVAAPAPASPRQAHSPPAPKQEPAAGGSPWKYGFSWLGVRHATPPPPVTHSLVETLGVRAPSQSLAAQAAAAATQPASASTSSPAESPTLLMLTTGLSCTMSPAACLSTPLDPDPLGSASTTSYMRPSSTTAAATGTPHRSITHLALPNNPSASQHALDPRPQPPSAACPGPMSPVLFTPAALGIHTYASCLPGSLYGLPLPVASPYQFGGCMGSSMDCFFPSAATPPRAAAQDTQSPGLHMSSPPANPRTLLRPALIAPSAHRTGGALPTALPFPSCYLTTPPLHQQHTGQEAADTATQYRPHQRWPGSTVQ